MSLEQPQIIPNANAPEAECPAELQAPLQAPLKAQPLGTDNLAPLAPMLKEPRKSSEPIIIPSISPKPQITVTPKIPVITVPVPVTVSPPVQKQLRINLPSLHELYTGFRVEVHSKVIDTLTGFMDRMGDDYGIDPEELKERYLADLRIVLEQDQQQQLQQQSKRNTSQRAKNPCNPAIRCMARTAGNDQCTRRRQVQNGIEFCGSHSLNQPYGRIDHSAPVVEKKKRGRPRKVESPYANDTVELKFEIVTETREGEDGQEGQEGEDGGQEYQKEFIRDQNNNVYEKPSSEMIGSLGELTRIGTYDPNTSTIIRSE